jgi:RNA polymerase sigma-70 factor (ECF subfamily)
METSDHLYRREAGRMVATLTRIFGVHNIALAEDVVHDAFCRALEVWKFRGIPENPSAWLMASAKNRALDVMRRERTALRYAPELGRLLESEWTLRPTLDEAFEPHAIKDDQLRMMFSCCNPRLTENAQIALILQLLCGFSVREVAAAYLIGYAAAEKRIGRAKKVLAASEGLFEIAGAADFTARLAAVQRALYLLFNEGYHGSSSESPVRTDLCREAMRLASLLLAHPLAATPATRALYALMCFNAARLTGRVDALGDLIPLADQDRSLWDRRLIDEGERYINLAATGAEVSEYHIEAALAAMHTCAPSAAETNWAEIVELYDALLRLRSSPVVELNRAIAIAQIDGPERGLAELRAISDSEKLASYPFYAAALGDFELRCGRGEYAREHFQSALSLARNPMERRFLERRLAACSAAAEAG